MELKKIEYIKYYFSLLVVLIIVCFYLTITRINKIELKNKEIEDITILRLYDNNAYFDKIPLDYVCTDNVYTMFVTNRSSYFSTWHKDERGTRDNELGFCFIKWRK